MAEHVTPEAIGLLSALTAKRGFKRKLYSASQTPLPPPVPAETDIDTTSVLT